MRKALLVALILLAIAPAAAFCQVYGSLGESLYAMGCRQALWIPSWNVNLRKQSPFNPSSPFNGMDPVQFQARYGVSLRDVKGNTVGERFSHDALVDWVRSGAARLPSAYYVTVQDDNDAKFVTCGGGLAVWDSRISPYVPVPQPQPTPAPVPQPTPAPIPSPPAASLLDFKRIDCPPSNTASTGRLCIEIWVR